LGGDNQSREKYGGPEKVRDSGREGTPSTIPRTKDYDPKELLPGKGSLEGRLRKKIPSEGGHFAGGGGDQLWGPGGKVPA